MAYYTAPNKTVKRLSKSTDSSDSSDSDSKLGSGITGLLKSPYLWAAIIVCVVIILYYKYYRN